MAGACTQAGRKDAKPPPAGAEGTIGAEGEVAREMARKRAAEELADNADVPTLCLPAEVSKRLRSNESATASSDATGGDVPSLNPP